MRFLILLCSALLLPLAASAKDRLYAGETLDRSNPLRSPNGQYVLMHKMYGNPDLAIFRADGTTRYVMGFGVDSVMQHDGNYVQYWDSRYPAENRAGWSTGTGGRCPCPAYHYLRIWDDGNLTIDYGDIPLVAYGRIWELGKDQAPLTTQTGFAEISLPPGLRPTVVPDPSFPPSLL